MAQIGNGSSEQVQRACAYLDTTLAGRTLPQNVKDKCAKLRTLVSFPHFADLRSRSYSRSSF